MTDTHSSPIPSDVGIILVDHGSKRPAANAMLEEVAAGFARSTGAAIVEAAHMELAAPTIQAAFDRCVARGARSVVIHPYFLAPGRHSTEDIPRMAAEAAAGHPNVPYRVSAPLGLDERLSEVILRRVLDALDSATP